MNNITIRIFINNNNKNGYMEIRIQYYNVGQYNYNIIIISNIIYTIIM